MLLLLKQKGQSYGYDLFGDLEEYALTDAEIERAAFYRTLRQLEHNGNVKSEWDSAPTGPPRALRRPKQARPRAPGRGAVRTP